MRYIISILLLPFAAYLLVINAKLYHHPKFVATENGFVNLDLKEQLYHLKLEMRAGAAEDMQAVFPEGYIFLNALYGLALCNYLTNSGGSLSPDYEALKVDLSQVSEALHSSTATRIFDKELPLEYGAYYNGWVSYFEGKRLAAVAPAARDSVQIAQFQANCQRIGEAYRRSDTPWLESYRLNTWPADNILCMAALCLHDQLFPPKYDTLVTNWLQRVKPLVDPNTGLIQHSVNMDGRPLEGARGSSQSLMLSFLPAIHSEFAAQQFALFQKHFVDNPFGMVAVREYPFGMEGNGDVDSGPLICGLGGAANIVGIAAFYQNGSPKMTFKLRNKVEGLSIPINWQGKKFYFFGALPMADAFLAWVNSFQVRPDKFNDMGVSWWQFHLFSAVILLCFYLMWRYLTSGKRRD